MEHRSIRIRVLMWSVGALGALGVSAASGDSLLLKDGRLVSGTVRHTNSGYVVQTRSGEQTFADDEVEHWTQSANPDGSEAPAMTPGSAKPPVTPAPGAAPGTPVSPVTGAPAVKGHDKTSQQKTIALLIDRGYEALAAGDYKSARDAYADALLLEPKNPLAEQGAGYAYLRLNNYTKARDALEAAYTGVQPTPRSLACNLAVALGKTRNPMRAAKVLKEYMAAHPTPLDEPALNALAAALAQADDQTRRNTFFAQVASFYDDYNHKLEATRPGEKRWGTRWLPGGETDARMKTWNEKRAKIDEILRRITNDQRAYAAAAQNAQDAALYAQFHANAAGKVAPFQAQMKQAQDDAQKASQDLAKVQEGFEQPPIDETLAVVVPEAVATAIASGSTAAPAAAGTDPSASATSTGGPDLPGRLFGNDPAPAGTGATHTPPPASAPPTVIAAAPAEPPAPKRKLHIQTNAVAFPVAPDLVVTAAEAVEGASSISIQLPGGDSLVAQVVSKDDASGLALLRIAGKKVAYLPLADSFTSGAVTCVSFPEVNLFDPVAVDVPGTVAPAAGGAGGAKWSVNLSRSPRLGGGPLMVDGKVVGVILANRDSEHGSIPAATLDDLKKLLGSNAPAAGSGGRLDPKTVTMQLTAIRDKG